MRQLWDFFLGRPTTLEAAVDSAHRFEVDVPYEVFGISSGSDPIAPVSRISRASAIQIPAVKRARDLIAGTLGTVPLDLIDSSNEASYSPLLDQPEANVPTSVTRTRLYEDLLFEGVAWLRIVETSHRGFPTKVRRLAPDRVQVRGDEVWVDGRKALASQLIRFDSPNDPLLVAGARAFKTLLRLEAAAAVQSEDPAPQGWFSPTDGADPLEDDEVEDVLRDWKLARQRSSTAYIPAALKYNTNQFSPEQLQLADARQKAVLEVSRCTGIDAEDLSVSTTSRTYFNGQDRRIQRLNDVLGPYLSAVVDRLRMNDITPRGYRVRPDLSAYLRADDSSRLGNYKTGLEIGLYTVDQVAEKEGLPAPESDGKQVVREAEKVTKEAASA